MFKTMILAAALVGAAASANAVTLLNASFEMGATGVATGTDVTNWTISPPSNGVFVSTPSDWAAAAGENSVLLWANGSVGTIGQQVELVKGKQYVLKFSYAADPTVGTPGQKAEGLFSIDEKNIGLEFFRPASYDTTNVGWIEYEYMFTADNNGQTLLSFNGNSGNRATALAIDAISLSLVPEPATWAMLIAGFGMVGFSVRRRRAALTSVVN